MVANIFWPPKAVSQQKAINADETWLACNPSPLPQKNKKTNKMMYFNLEKMDGLL